MADDFEDVVENVKHGATWMRVVHMVGFCIVLYVVMLVVWFLTGAQALFSIFTGSDNRNLRVLGSSLTEYVAEILLFVTCNSESRPFPFKPFPAGADQVHASRGETATEESEPVANAGGDSTSKDSEAQSAGPTGSEFDDLAFLSRSAETEEEADSELGSENQGQMSSEEQNHLDTGVDEADATGGTDEAKEAGVTKEAGDTEETEERKPTPDE